MREIKFRAWDKITKQYYIVKGLEYDNDGNLDEVYLAGVKISESNPVFNLRKPNDVVLEQYTDVKDDNDKEIAEGDIVQYIGADEETLIQATVKYGNLANEDRTLYIRGFYYGDCKIDESANLDDEEYEDLCIRVIGNIHENPELLGEQKMKRVLLKNKKTGVIGELSGVNRIVVYEPDMPLCGNSILGEYDTLAELNKDWEDYKPIELLIKDEKVKKLLGEVVELELTVNELNKRFDEFNKHYVELCGEKK